MAPRLLIVVNEYPPDVIAGTAMSTKLVAEEVARRGWAVDVVVTARRGSAASEQAGGVAVHRLRPVALRGTRMAQRAWSLRRLVRELAPDVIHGQAISCGFLGLLAAGGRVPVITNVQGQDLLCASAIARRTYVSWTLRRSAEIAAPTHDLAGRARGLAPRDVHVIPHPLAPRAEAALPRHAARAQLGLAPDGPIVLFVGRLSPEKGVTDLVRAFATVRPARPESRLCIVGDGALRDALEAEVRRLGLAGACVFLGSRGHHEVFVAMRAADVLVLPSHREAFGMVLVEAMRCGLPIVASRVGGIPEVVQDGITAWLVPPGDIQALAATLDRVLGDRPSRSAMADRGPPAAEPFALARVVDRWMGVWAAHGADDGGGPRA